MGLIDEIEARERAYRAGEMAERARLRQLFLAWAEDYFGWKLKDPADERHIREMLATIDSGEMPEKHLTLIDSDPDALGLPTIREEE